MSTPIAAIARGFALGSALIAAVAMAQQAPVPKQAQQPANQPPKRVQTNMTGFDLSANAGKSQNQVPGTSRGGMTKQPQLAAPQLGKAFSTRPFFQWLQPEPDAKVTFTLMAADGQTIYETSTTAGSLKYPADAPALLPGSNYQWTVEPDAGIEGGKLKPVSFIIVFGAERDKIASELDSANGLAAASVFVTHRIWYDAVEVYTDRLTQAPDDIEARKGRSDVYASIPATKELLDADNALIH